MKTASDLIPIGIRVRLRDHSLYGGFGKAWNDEGVITRHKDEWTYFRPDHHVGKRCTRKCGGVDAGIEGDGGFSHDDFEIIDMDLPGVTYD